MNDRLAARKLRHIDACLTGPVEFVGVTTGFEWFDLPYNAMTQTSLAAVDLSTRFLGAGLRAPVLIGAMTGGADLARTINRNLAGAAQQLGIGMMLGSQRIMLGDGDDASASASTAVCAPLRSTSRPANSSRSSAGFTSAARSGAASGGSGRATPLCTTISRTKRIPPAA